MMKFIGLTASILFACGSAHAQSYPTRPITMVVPFAAGGATDVIARIVAEGMSEDLGQSIVIENVAGAGGTTGSARVMRADPDGYTILTGHMGTHASAYSLYEKPKYDPRTDFQPVGLAASAPIVIFARKDLPANNLKEFTDYLKDKGAGVKVGHSGVGSNAHLTCMLLSSLVGAKPTQVAYRGNGPLMTDLMSGTIDYSCDQVITVASQVTAGTVKALVVAGKERSKALPDVPTSVEAGVPAYQADAWTAIFAPAKTPPEVLDRLSKSYAKALDNPRVVSRLNELGAVVPSPEQRTPEYLRKLVETDVKRWGDVISQANVKISE
jgi:tripartite-type tricarboxylate transporter receptor subunit TctC